jgi:hypothetical protein
MILATRHVGTAHVQIGPAGRAPTLGTVEIHLRHGRTADRVATEEASTLGAEPVPCRRSVRDIRTRRWQGHKLSPLDHRCLRRITTVSRTDKTTPYRVVQTRGECRRAHCAGYPCRHVSLTTYVATGRRGYLRADRFGVRKALARGDDPPIDQHRHRARWAAV